MFEFLDAVQQYAFLQTALLTGLLASVACGVIGSYVVVRRITYVAGGIAHCVLGGMGAARYLAVVHGWEWLHPLYGAVVAALIAAVIIGLVSLRGRQREDTVIGRVVGHRHGHGRAVHRPHAGIPGRADELPVREHPDW